MLTATLIIFMLVSMSLVVSAVHAKQDTTGNFILVAYPLIMILIVAIW